MSDLSWGERARDLFPGGVNSPVRAFRNVGAEPFLVKKAIGARLWTEDGKELVLEFVDALEYNGQMYQAFFPAETEGENEDDPDNGLVILKVIHEDGEDLLSTLDSDEELEAVYEQFMELLFDEDEE